MRRFYIMLFLTTLAFIAQRRYIKSKDNKTREASKKSSSAKIDGTRDESLVKGMSD